MVASSQRIAERRRVRGSNGYVAARDHELASQIVDAFMGHSAMYATSGFAPATRQVR